MPSKKRAQPRVPPKDWDFFRFETFAGFSLGVFVAFALAVAGVGQLIFLLAMFCTSFSVAHIVTRAFARRRLETTQARKEEEERERRALAARGITEPEAATAGPPSRRRRRRKR